MSEQWFQSHDVVNKLRQAMESIVVGQALHIVFDGLQDGKCTVEVVYNGETIDFLNKTPTLNKQETPVQIPLSQKFIEDNTVLVEEPVQVPKRKKKVTEASTVEDT
jgi:hypothetical protein